MFSCSWRFMRNLSCDARVVFHLLIAGCLWLKTRRDRRSFLPSETLQCSKVLYIFLTRTHQRVWYSWQLEYSINFSVPWLIMCFTWFHGNMLGWNGFETKSHHTFHYGYWSFLVTIFAPKKWTSQAFLGISWLIIISPCRGHGQIKRYPDFEPHPNIILLVIYIYIVF